MDSTLVFAYNADSGLFNGLSDLAHKMFSPETYACNLCALTYSAVGMRNEWKQFLECLPGKKSFFHADELKKIHGVTGVSLPAIFKLNGAELKVWISAEEINMCTTLKDLQTLIASRIKEH